MARFLGALLVSVIVFGLSDSVRAADTKDAKAILDKAIKALGGEANLGKAKGFSWTHKGTINFGGTDNQFTGHAVAEGLDHYRQDFEGEFGGNQVKGVTVVAGNKGWRKFGDNQMELDQDALTAEKQRVYLTVIPITILPLRSKQFKMETIGEDKADGKPALGIKATGPDGKEFKVYFDKESGLPVRIVAKVVGFMGDEYTQDTTFSDFKEVDGIKKAMKSETKRDGEKFLDLQISDFKVLDHVDPKNFAEPQ
jgi:hypothetical protein